MQTLVRCGETRTGQEWHKPSDDREENRLAATISISGAFGDVVDYLVCYSTGAPWRTNRR
jgi:hypothetical protein